jgi:thymidylate synthase (FAD)
MMKVINSSYEILSCPENLLEIIERAGRTCYKSEDRITAESAGIFCRNLISTSHHSVIEHANITVKFICDRGVSHELVRHRLASYSQESTRYCNYSKDKFSNEITVIKPCFWSEDSDEFFLWHNACLYAEKTYLELIKSGVTAEKARSVLPTSLKTEIVMTANVREWRHVLKLRTSKAAHPQIREIMMPLLADLKGRLPELFDDLNGGE